MGRRSRLRALLVLTAVLSGIAFFQVSCREPPPERAPTSAHVRLRLVEQRHQRFVALLQTAAARVAALPEGPPALAGNRAAVSRLFGRLETLRERTPERPALAVHAIPLTPLAWVGRVVEIQGFENLTVRSDVFILKGSVTTTMVAATPIAAANGRVLGVATAELPIAVHRNIHNAYLSDFDRLIAADTGVQVEYLDVRQTPDTLATPASTSAGPSFATALLRAPDGDILAAARAVAAREPNRALPTRTYWWLSAAAVLVILLWFGWSRRAIPGPIRWIAAATAARLAVAGSGVSLPGPRYSTHAEGFATPQLDSFTATPLGLLLTAAWLTLIAAVLLGAVLRRASPSHRPWAASVRSWAISVAGLPILAGTFAWIADTSNHCSIDLEAFSLLPTTWLHAVLHTALLLILAGGGMLLTALLCFADSLPSRRLDLSVRIGGWLVLGYLAYRVWPRPLIGLPLVPAVVFFAVTTTVAGTRDRWLSWLQTATAGTVGFLVVAGVAFLSLLLFPSLNHFGEKALRQRIEGHDRWLVLRQSDWRDRVLADTRNRIDQLRLLEKADPDRAPIPAEELAFAVWSQTELASYGMSSAIEIQDASGRAISRFALNLPSLSTPLQPLPSGPHWETVQESARVAGGGGHILHSRRLLAYGDDVRGAIHIFLREDYWHLPFIRARDPYSALYRTTLEDATGNRPLGLIVFDHRRNSVFSSEEKPPALDTQLVTRQRRSPTGFWTTLTIDGRAEHSFLFGDAQYIYVLSYPRTSAGHFAADLAEAASGMTLLALGGLFVTILVRTVLRYRSLSLDSLARTVAERFTLRMFLALALVAFAPLLVIETVVRGFVVDRLRKETDADALQRAAVAKKAVEDYVLFQGDETSAARPGLDAGLVYIASLMRNDLDVFVHGRLLASSKRELYASGLLPSRLSGSIYRALVLDGEPAILATERIGGLSYLVVSVPVRLGSLEPAVLSIPLALRQREVEGVLQDLDRTIRLVSVLFLAAAGLLAHSLARRISDPIRALTEATERVAQGDLSARVTSKSRDELATLVKSFNRMASDLDRQRRDLERSNRLAAWAEMARQIAHEIKNPLTPIQLSAEHLRRVYGDTGSDFGATLEACTETIMRQVRTLRGIVTEFSAFARPPSSPLVPEDVAAIASDAVAPYVTALPPGVSLRLDIPPQLPRVSADRRLLERAIVNLVENALHAVGDTGMVVVRLSAAGSRLAIEVEDNGRGIDPEIRDRVFEPFFSTKTGGSGLGLALVKKITEDHGGGVDMESEPGRTRVRLWLPTVESATE